MLSIRTCFQISLTRIACPDASERIRIRLTNKARQTPNDLSKIYCPNDAEVISLTTLPVRQVNDIIGGDDIASGESADTFFVVLFVDSEYVLEDGEGADSE